MSRSTSFNQTRRQELQTRIARSRRRIERNFGRLMDRTLLFGSWSEYVREHPGKSLLAAAGVGMALSGLVARLPMPGQAWERIAEFAMGAGWSRVLAEVSAALDRLKDAPGETTTST